MDRALTPPPPPQKNALFNMYRVVSNQPLLLGLMLQQTAVDLETRWGYLLVLAFSSKDLWAKDYFYTSTYCSSDSGRKELWS